MSDTQQRRGKLPPRTAIPIAVESHDILQWPLNDTFSPIGVAGPAAAIPTLSQWALLLLATAIAAVAWFARQRRA